MALLEIRDLHVSFETRDGIVHAVDFVSLAVDRGRTLGVAASPGRGERHGTDRDGLTRLPNGLSPARCCSTASTFSRCRPTSLAACAASAPR